MLGASCSKSAVLLTVYHLYVSLYLELNILYYIHEQLAELKLLTVNYAFSI